MSQDGPDAGTIITGVFLILFGLCLTLVGGGCTVLWIALMTSESVDQMSIMLLLISAVVLAGGITAIVFGIRLMIKRQAQPAFGSVEPGADRPAARLGDEGLNDPDQMKQE
jgi:hypothetical protein